MATADTDTVGCWLHRLREAKKEPLRVVAASLSMDPTLLSKIERGERLPTAKQASLLASYFGIPEEELQAMRIAADFLGRYGNHREALRAAVIVQSLLADCNRAPDAGPGEDL